MRNKLPVRKIRASRASSRGFFLRRVRIMSYGSSTGDDARVKKAR
ncbi:hypothetical protein [Burkholderia anthina]|nr:hypothetical protein [Burkholderia anthina]